MAVITQAPPDTAQQRPTDRRRRAYHAKVPAPVSGRRPAARRPGRGRAATGSPPISRARTGSPTTPSDRPLWPEPWASQVMAQADYLEVRLQTSLASVVLTPAQKQARDGVISLLDQAREATRRGSKRLRRVSEFWRGTSVESAHYYLHAAKAAMVDLYSAAEIDAALPDALARVGASLRPTDVRRLAVEKLAVETDLGRKRVGLRHALEIGYDASDQQHSRLRTLRNLIFKISIAIAVFMVLLVVIVWMYPSSTPLCFTPTITTAEPAAPGQAGTSVTRTVCPSGESAASQVTTTRPPDKKDVAIVAGLGAIGGAVAAAFALRNIRGTSTPYDVPLALAVLKVPTGSLAAVAGILLLRGNFVPGLSELDSQGQILAYALLLGYAQQLATQFVDKQAQSVLEAVPSKDGKAKEPMTSSPGGDGAGSPPA